MINQHAVTTQEYFWGALVNLLLAESLHSCIALKRLTCIHGKSLFKKHIGVTYNFILETSFIH